MNNRCPYVTSLSNSAGTSSSDQITTVFHVADKLDACRAYIYQIIIYFQWLPPSYHLILQPSSTISGPTEVCINLDYDDLAMPWQ